MRPIEKQETCINFMRGSNVCTIYTSDSTMVTRMDKFVENPDASEWKLKEEHHTQDGELVGKTYITDKRLVSFRRSIRVLTEEQREAAVARMRVWQAKKRQEEV